MRQPPLQQVLRRPDDGPQGIELVPDHVAHAVGLGKASDLKGWNSKYFAEFSAEFESMLQREQRDTAFWQSHA